MERFYVYKWVNKDSGEVFYVGKGCGKRYKALSKRSKCFMDYIHAHNVESLIVNYFDVEEDAFAYEHELIAYYKGIGQCECNFRSGGYGGYSKSWSPERRKYWAQYNPMHDAEQRKRFSVNNPMKRKDVAENVGMSHRRAVVLNGVEYSGAVEAAKILGVTTNTILVWCKRGYDTDGNPCRYADSSQLEYSFTKTSSREILIDGEYRYKSLIDAAINFFGVRDSNPLCKALKTGKPYHNHIVEYANQQPS